MPHIAEFPVLELLAAAVRPASRLRGRIDLYPIPGIFLRRMYKWCPLDSHA